MSVFLQRAQEVAEEVVCLRRKIHEHPELGNEEVMTSALIREKLEEYGVDEIQCLTPTSVVAMIHGTRGPGKCVALRADIDALPIQEETGLPYASKVPGVMHACGHDTHCAMMLGNAKILCGMRDQFAGTVKLIFQHSEDLMPGGARVLVREGVMNGVDAIFGMHIFPSEKEVCGTIGIKNGAMFMSAEEYWFDIQGVGGHGSQPHKVPDPILAAAEIIMMLQQVQARAVDPMDTAIFMMNKIEGGVAPNVISDRVRMCGNARAGSVAAKKKIEEYAYRIANGVEAISGCRIEVTNPPGYDPVENDPELVSQIIPFLENAVGGDKVQIMDKPLAGAEDFSFYSTLTGVPGAFMTLAGGNLGEVLPVHNARVTFDEKAFPYGMAAMTACAVSYLND